MKKTKGRSLKENIQRTFLLYALIPSLAFTLAAFLVVVSIFIITDRERTVETNETIAAGLEDILICYGDEALRLGSDDEMFRAIANRKMNAEKYAEIYSFINSQKLRCNFFIVNQANQVIAGSTRSVPDYITDSPIFNIGILQRIRENPERVSLSLENSYNRTEKVLTIGTTVRNKEHTAGVIIFEFNEDDFTDCFFKISSTDLVLTNRHDYVCWSSDKLLTDRYGKIVNDFQEKSGSIEALGTHFFTCYKPILNGDLHVYTITKLGSYQRIFSSVSLALITISAILIVCSMLASRRVAQKNTTGIDKIVETMQYARTGDFSHPLVLDTGDELETIAASYNKMLADIKQLISDKEEAARQNILSEVKQLESQFDPHFLFNTLELIKYMTKIAPDQVGKVIVGFSALLRESINNTVSDITLQEDWEYTQNYLMIQKYRFGDQLSYESNILPETLDCIVPKRMIQPIVENAMKYGKNQDNCCRLHIQTGLDRNILVISISDEGPGILPRRLEEVRSILNQRKNQSSHNGLYNVHRRIQLIYGADYGVEIMNRKGKGTLVTVRLPARKGEAKHDESSGC